MGQKFLGLRFYSIWLPKEYDDAGEEECCDAAEEMGEEIEDWEFWTIGHMCDEEVIRRIRSN